MQEVHLYAEAGDSRRGKARRHAAYILELVTASGAKGTLTGFVDVDGTYNAAILEAMSFALSRMTKACCLHLHTQNAYVLNAIQYRLPGWEEKGYITTKGDPIAGADDWKRLSAFLHGHETAFEPGTHPYLGWMERETKKRDETYEEHLPG